MVGMRLSSAKVASIIAMSAALYAVFFFLSSLAGVPSFLVQPEESTARKIVPLLFIKLGLGEM